MHNHSSCTLAVIGDTQHTLWAERVFLRREDNARAREVLLQNFAEENFGVLVHLGDMTESGASQAAWREFDRNFAPIWAKGAAFIPMMGNHDYWGNARRRRAQIATRFPQLAQQAWRAEIFQNLGLICIDSNRGQYSRAAWAEQERWFEKTLAAFTQSQQIQAILVFSHHPPFTNSAVMARAKFLENFFVPAFFSSSKTKAFISGHVHGYERFMMQGRAFIVSGGGGGPRLPLRRMKRRKYVDVYEAGQHPPGLQGRNLNGEAVPRPLHYLLITPETLQLRLAAWGLCNGAARVSVFDEIVMPMDSVLTS